MKKSELKEMIKATMSGGEVPGMRPFDLEKPARIAAFILALDNLLDEYHAELYLSDDVFAAIEAAKSAAKEAMNLNEAYEATSYDTLVGPVIMGIGNIKKYVQTSAPEYLDSLAAAEDAFMAFNDKMAYGDEIGDMPGFEGTKDSLRSLGLEEAEEEVEDEEVDVEVGDEEVETTDVETTAEVDPNIKAVQDSLTAAQAAAAALGDEKLTDQIGNTITFFTRQHVASVDSMSEISLSPNSAGDDNEGVEDVNVDDPAKDAMVGLTENLRWKRIAGIAKDNGLYSTLKEGYSPGQGWTEDFSYDDMLAHGLTLTADTPLEDLQKVVDDFEDVNYHREAAHLFDAIDAINAGNRGEAKMYINKFHKEIQKTLA